MRKFIFIGLVLIAVGLGIGYNMYNKPLDTIEGMTTDFKLSSVALLETFENDETGANEKYLDKVIEVKGKVSKVENENDKTTIYLATENELSQIICQLEQHDESIKEGQEVIIKGICTGFLMDVVLVRAKKL